MGSNNITHEEHSISSSTVDIPSVICRSPRKSRHIVIMCHGITSDKDEYLGFFRTIATELAKREVDSLRFDFRGHGQSNVGCEGFTVSSQLEDLLATFNHCNNGQYESISLLGCSYGAPPCLMFNSFSNSKIERIFLVAPVLDYKKTFFEPSTNWGLEIFGKKNIQNVFDGGKIVLSDSVYFSSKNFSEMESLNIDNFIGNPFNCSIDIFHGDCDDMVPYSVSEEISKKFENVKLHRFENMEHGFTNKGDESGDSPKSIQNINRMIEIISDALNEQK